MLKNSCGGRVGMGHTRWATHGPAVERNAHPHIGGDNAVYVVHNGVIENFAVLKEELVQQGYRFRSDTDTEVIAHLVDAGLRKGFGSGGSDPNAPYLNAVRWATSRLRGTYGLAIMFRDRPDLLIAARFGSPLVVGVGRGEYYLASDTAPLAGHTDRIVYLADHQIATLTLKGFSVHHRDQGPVSPQIETVRLDDFVPNLEGFDHYMLKEIYEQPESLLNAMRGRLDDQDATAIFGGLNLTPQQLRGVDRIILTGCGTSWHAALVGEYLIEELARIPVEVE
jgi:glucosamine--fructose-6-phosphate aminotransferase (isomerizing)